MQESYKPRAAERFLFTSLLKEVQPPVPMLEFGKRASTDKSVIKPSSRSERAPTRKTSIVIHLVNRYLVYYPFRLISTTKI